MQLSVTQMPLQLNILLTRCSSLLSQLLLLLLLLLMLLKAVKRNAKHPDFHGLDIYLSHMPDGQGNLEHGDWGKFLAEELKTQAVTMKQFRLTRDEEEQGEKGNKGGSGEPTANAKAKAKAKVS